MTIRPFRFIYLVTLSVVAFSYLGWLGLLFMFLASCDLEINAR